MISSPQPGKGIHGSKTKAYTPKFNLQLVLEVLRGERSEIEIGPAHEVHYTFWGRFSTKYAELILEAKTLEEVRRIMAEQLDYCNRKRRHWGFANRRPCKVVLAATSGEDTPPEL